MPPETLFDPRRFDEKLAEMAEALAALTPDVAHGALVGIRTRGAHLAARLRERLARDHHLDLPLGVLDITLYRDDLSQLAAQPVVRDTQLDFALDGRTLILIDDVLYTGRTIRSAMDQLVDFGRPAAIRLAVFVDRGGHEYPIRPDYAALTLDVPDDHIVQVRLAESDGEDGVVLVEGRHTA